MRFKNMRRLAAATTAASLAFVSFTAVAEPASAELSDVVTLVPAPDTTVVKSVSLPNNVVLLHTAGDSYVIGPSDIGLTVVDDELGSRLGVVAPDPSTSPTPGWTDDGMQSVLEQARRGASLEDIADRADQFITTTNTNEPLYNTACVDASNNVQYQVTCTNRAPGSTYGADKYVGSKSFTTGQIYEPARDRKELVRVTHQDNYDSGTQRIVQWEPSATKYGDRCANVGLSLSGYGLSLSLSKALCPVQMDPYLFSAAQQFKTTWRGNVSGSATSYQIETVKVPAAADSLLIFSGYTESRPKCGSLSLLCQAWHQVWG